jgi:hypothetical protein
MGDRRGGSEGEGEAGRLTIRPETVGAARKTAAKKKPAKKGVRRPAKKEPSRSRAVGQCPDTPKDFFAAIHAWSVEFLVWASEVDSCWDSTCDTQESRQGLDELCRAFRTFARDAKDWGDEVEACFMNECGGPPGHTRPPPPPF